MLSLLHKSTETFQKSFNYHMSMNYKGKVYFVYTLFTWGLWLDSALELLALMCSVCAFDHAALSQSWENFCFIKRKIQTRFDVYRNACLLLFLRQGNLGFNISTVLPRSLCNQSFQGGLNGEQKSFGCGGDGVLHTFFFKGCTRIKMVSNLVYS